MLNLPSVHSRSSTSPYRVVIVGAGFAGLYAAKKLLHPAIEVTLIDKRNFHLFQPLLYQVATGVLSERDISSPIRAILNRHTNINVLMGEVVDIDSTQQNVRLRSSQEVPYDSLIVATGVSHQYFGNEHWSEIAPGMKTVEDALEVRRRILLVFEALEHETDPQKRQALSTFVVVGGGPTGVELAGALAELAYGTLRDDFRSLDTSEIQILLVQSQNRLLPHYSSQLSAEAEVSLLKIGVTVQTGTRVTHIDGDSVTLKKSDRIQQIKTQTILWTAGVKASPLGRVLAMRTEAPLDKVGRVMVEPDFSVPNHPNIFVIGDLCHYAHQKDSQLLPGIAPVAMQEGQYVANLIRKSLTGETPAPFQYQDTGRLAVIGRNSAVIEYGMFKLSGFLAWLAWLFIHIYFLIEFDNKLVVMFHWAWNYFTRRRGARLITEQEKACRTSCRSNFSRKQPSSNGSRKAAT